MSSLVPKKMKVAELREALAARNFAAPSKWLKEQLVEKLEDILKQEVSSNSSPSAIAASSSSSDSQLAASSSSVAPAAVADSSVATSGSVLVAQQSSSADTTSSHALKLSVDLEESLDAKKAQTCREVWHPGCHDSGRETGCSCSEVWS